nr:retrovirus-related Pol polyprotein from transposon TNT 1-94 [Tanacetum cinerariifolium]
LKAKADIGIFVGYAPTKEAYRIFNKRTRKIHETVHVTFDELSEGMTYVHSSTGLEPNTMAHVHNGVGPEIFTLQSVRTRSELLNDPTTPSTKNHSLENVIGDLHRPVSTRQQLETDAMWCFFNEFLTHVEPKNYKQALEHSCWIEAM